MSLAVTCALAVVMASLAQLSGLASEESQALRVTANALDLRIAGIVVGALGVLDDVTVSQVSTVNALRRANPDLGARQLYTEATNVGRDHVASAVNTLALAYAGASLPLLLFFAQGNQPTGRLITSEIVAIEIVPMLVGSIGLVLSVLTPPRPATRSPQAYPPPAAPLAPNAASNNPKPATTTGGTPTQPPAHPTPPNPGSDS